MTQSTIRALLCFGPQTLSGGFNQGENLIDILTVNSILVNCDLINGSPVAYSFFPNVSPGYKIFESPSNLVYLSISPAGSVHCVLVWLTDQQLNLRGETITIRFHIRSI